MWDSEIPLGNGTVPLWGFAFVNSVVWGGITFLGTRRSLKDCELPVGKWALGFGLLGAIAAVFFIVSVSLFQTQQTPVVRPSEVGSSLRMVYHLSLISLLLMLTATDLRSYYLLEWTCWLGIVIGLVGATASGEFQLVHVWVDWNQELPQLRGPYIPDWLAAHQHLHGFVWSLCGIAMGCLLAWLTQQISTFVLGMPTLGTGDIYLMAMIGAYLGWQPTLIAFSIAPPLALLIGGCLRTVSNQPALPYGPFLAIGAMLTLFFWRAFWMLEIPLTLDPNPTRDSIFAVRRFLGDWISLLMTFGLAAILFVVLLSLLKFYKSLNLK